MSDDNTPTPTPTAPPAQPMMYDSIDELISTYNAADIPGRRTAALGYSNASCGITVLSGVSKIPPNFIVRKVLVERSPGDYKKVREAFVMWSDIDHKGDWGGNALEKYIRDNNLGSITAFGPTKNPNSGNMIKMWVWQPPHESFEPKDKFMPVHGQKRVLTPSGHVLEYVDLGSGKSEVPDDRRFLDVRSGNKLEPVAK